MSEAALIEKILEAIDAKKPAYMSLQDIASDLRISYSAAVHITAQPDFPRPARLPSRRGKSAHPRWPRRDVIAYAERYRK